MLFCNSVKIYRNKNNIFKYCGSIVHTSKIIVLGSNNESIIITDTTINQYTICLEEDNNCVRTEEKVLTFGKAEIDTLEGINVTIDKNTIFSSNIIIGVHS